MNQEVKTVPITIVTKQHQLAMLVKDDMGSSSWDIFFMELVYKEADRRNIKL